ncbi:permease [Wenzhouxiangella sp. XN79A]|uniref:permease n=1 Tax=Wenzhouxiangella sp. XN79A TaxID=2724193 RepID=UPI00144ADC26|nr:permease [Wenzhouxiangella sp. XN79A]NKI34358.1 permease [Wenzhouxiangella sp. XN79A]
MDEALATWSEAARTSLGFFWKAGWAFVLGYAISAMIQTFVPKHRLTRHMGEAGFKSTAIATGFGAISSSCSFAALAAARSLIVKGAHWIAAVAFMFASTNLVIELGILIYLFLGWQYVVAEIIGGLILIAISSVLIKLVYPKAWLEEAREKVEHEAADEDDDFDPWQRMTSREGWNRVGHQFVMEWKMVWQEILIGFTIAGLMKAFIPAAFWEALFLQGLDLDLAAWVVTLQNVIVAPFVAAATFIGSMGNIPLATVLASSGVGFAGLMAFIYSDLMVPPLVKVNARYYGWRVALYIAGIMFVSIVCTALLLDFGFGALGMRPKGAADEAGGDAFAIDYTFFLNLGFVLVAAVLIGLHRSHMAASGDGEGHDHDGDGLGVQDMAAGLAIALLVIGIILFFVV